MAEENWDEEDDVEVKGVNKLSLGADDEDDADDTVSGLIRDLEGKVKAAPNDASLHARLAKAYFNKEDDESALKSYAKAVELDPKNAQLHQEMATVHLYGNDTEAALKHLQTALQLAPNNASVLYDLGKAYQVDEKHDKALDCFRKAVAQDASHSKALFQVATYLLNETDEKTKDKRQEEALSLFKKVTTLDASYKNAFFNVGQILQTRNAGDDLKEAVKYFATAAKLDPADAQVRGKLVQCYDQLGMENEREAERSSLEKAFAAGQLNPAYTSVGRYCCSQFQVGDKFVMCYDHFETKDADAVKYAFLVYRVGQIHPDKVLFRVVLGRSPKRQGYYVDSITNEDKATNYGLFQQALPAYSKVKELATQIIKGDAKPL